MFVLIRVPLRMYSPLVLKVLCNSNMFTATYDTLLFHGVTMKSIGTIILNTHCRVRVQYSAASTILPLGLVGMAVRLLAIANALVRVARRLKMAPV